MAQTCQKPRQTVNVGIHHARISRANSSCWRKNVGSETGRCAPRDRGRRKEGAGNWAAHEHISQKKAYTSRAFDIATKDLATHSQSGGQFFGIHASNDGKIMIFAGGIPLKRDGKVVGAIGVSGGSGEQDHAVAEAGAAAF
jgi:hypothetical protein